MRPLPDLRVHSSVNVADLEPDFQRRLWWALNDPRLRHLVRILSGVRTRAEQQVLFDQYGFPRAARPGTSNHERGLAADLQIVMDDDLIVWPHVHLVLWDYGLWAPLKSPTVREDWHIERHPLAIPFDPLAVLGEIMSITPADADLIATAVVDKLYDAFANRPLVELMDAYSNPPGLLSDYPLASTAAFIHRNTLLTDLRISGTPVPQAHS